MDKSQKLSVETQAHIWNSMQAFLESMVLRCAVELGIADIIHSQGKPVPLPTIAGHLSPPAGNQSALFRIIRYLVRKGIFATSTDPATGATLYDNTPCSQWLLSTSKLRLSPMVTLVTSSHGTSPWHHLSDCVRHGGTAFEAATGVALWDSHSQNPELDQTFNTGMACTIDVIWDALASSYKDGFAGLGSVVDVGGGTGSAVRELTKMYPGLRGVNFDQPHVVATAPEYPGVVHVGGNMFEAIPPADAVFMKWILHCFPDESCIKILKNCRKAIPAKTGKLIIVEAVVDVDKEDVFEDARLAYDIIMLGSTGGKERTEEEWKNLLKLGGFLRYKIIRIPALTWIIEAYPE